VRNISSVAAQINSHRCLTRSIVFIFPQNLLIIRSLVQSCYKLIYPLKIYKPMLRGLIGRLFVGIP